MKAHTHNIILLSLLVTIFCVIDCLITSLYWQHSSIVHHAARYEVSSWGTVSFHWNDDSAQTPFMDTSFVSYKK
jgi:hypothetical protein